MRGTDKLKKRQSITAFEPLEDRVQLSIFVPTPPTPAPAPSPFNVAMVRRFEHRLNQLDRQFMSQARQINSMVARRAVQLEGRLSQATSRAQLQVQAALRGSSVTPQVIMTNQTQAINSQLASLFVKSSASLNQLNNSMQHRFGLFISPFEQSDSRFGIPASL